MFFQWKVWNIGNCKENIQMSNGECYLNRLGICEKIERNNALHTVFGKFELAVVGFARLTLKLIILEHN